jgi:hypothetical protein
VVQAGVVDREVQVEVEHRDKVIQVVQEVRLVRGTAVEVEVRVDQVETLLERRVVTEVQVFNTQLVEP